jgi:hypothetical protein
VERLDHIAKQDGRLTVTGAPAGYDAFIAAEAARRRGGPVLFVATDDAAAENATRAIRFFAPDMAVLSFPALNPGCPGAGVQCVCHHHHHQCGLAACAAQDLDRWGQLRRQDRR